YRPAGRGPPGGDETLSHGRGHDRCLLGQCQLTTMNSSNHIRQGACRWACEQLDASLRGWALDSGGDEQSFPVLIAAETLRRAEYPAAFPHLLMAPGVPADPVEPMARANILLTEHYLSPAVCYHAYAELENLTLERG